MCASELCWISQRQSQNVDAAATRIALSSEPKYMHEFVFLGAKGIWKWINHRKANM